MAARPEIDTTASCDCGAVTMQVRGRVASMFLCSCENCQRATGTGHSAAVLLPAAAVTIIGEIKSYTRPADSGGEFIRHFCPACGTTVLAQSSRAPQMRIVPVGLFSDNDWFSPSQLLFARTHRDWDVVPTVEQHQRYRETL
jgi:hypothetical protein